MYVRVFNVYASVVTLNKWLERTKSFGPQEQKVEIKYIEVVGL